MRHNAGCRRDWQFVPWLTAWGVADVTTWYRNARGASRRTDRFNLYDYWRLTRTPTTTPSAPRDAAAGKRDQGHDWWETPAPGMPTFVLANCRPPTEEGGTFFVIRTCRRQDARWTGPWSRVPGARRVG
jgi:hypothetical protein